MARQFTSLAAKYRHHRKCFELALELGITPKEAETRLALMEIRERQRARCARRGVGPRQQRLTTPRGTELSGVDFERFDASWMMRD